MPEDLIVNENVTIPAAELSYTASRASGPGGQHVNTSDTRIQVRWNVAESEVLYPDQRRLLLAAFASRLTDNGEIILASDTHRSQRRNREEVRQRLADLVRAALVPRRPRKKTRPSASSREQRLKDKKKRSQVKKNRGKPDSGD